MHVLTTIVSFAFALGLLIFVHEFGHYLAARVCNVKVLRFSVGFGRVLASRRHGKDETEWAIGVVPLGGYVKMLDEREGAVAEADLPRAFNRQSVYRRFVIVVAGPAANFLLAIFLYWLVFMHGVPGIKPVIGAVTPDSPVAQAQLAVGDTLLKIGSVAVATWQDARWMLLKHAVERRAVVLEVENGRGEIYLRSLDMSRLAPADLDGDFLRVLGFARLQPPLAPVIGRVVAGGVADRAGLLTGDVVLAAGGAPVVRWDEVVAAVSASPERQLALRIKRGDTTLDVQVVPAAVLETAGQVGRIGIAVRVDEAAMRQFIVEVRYSPWTSMGKALERIRARKIRYEIHPICADWPA